MTKYKTIYLEEGSFKTNFNQKYLNRKKYVKDNPKEIKAVIPGVIRKIYVKKGQNIKPGDDLFILEAMKMKNVIKSDIKGIIENINFKVGDQVIKDQIVITIF